MAILQLDTAVVGFKQLLALICAGNGDPDDPGPGASQVTAMWTGKDVVLTCDYADSNTGALEVPGYPIDPKVQFPIIGFPEETASIKERLNQLLTNGTSLKILSGRSDQTCCAVWRLAQAPVSQPADNEDKSDPVQWGATAVNETNGTPLTG